jgi:pyruvate,water dikinase
MASAVRADPSVAEMLRERDLARIDGGFLELMGGFVKRFGDLSHAITGGSRCDQAPDALIKILLEMAAHPPVDTRLSPGGVEVLRADYLAQFDGDERSWAEELLELARVSYRLRDDDDIYLGMIEAEALAAVNEGKERLKERGVRNIGSFGAEDVAKALRDRAYVPEAPSGEQTSSGFEIRARQLIGQPAGPGLVTGPARVIATTSHLAEFQYEASWSATP